MRRFLCLLFIFITVTSFAQENSLSFKRKLKASATVSLNSNGIASIPAFSLDKPAVMASISLVKNRFSYDATLAYGLDLKPWFIDNWLHYKLIVKPSFELRAGFNISSFFSQYTPPAPEIIWYTQRYFALEVAGLYKFSPVSSLSLLYWSDNGQEPESLKGHYVGLFYDRTEINLGKKLLLGISTQLFYINYDGENDGLFISPKISTSVKNLPYTLFLQANQGIQSNITPFPGFKWNIGMAFAF